MRKEVGEVRSKRPVCAPHVLVREVPSCLSVREGGDGLSTDERFPAPVPDGERRREG